jgi:hypothetical protein
MADRDDHARLREAAARYVQVARQTLNDLVRNAAVPLSLADETGKTFRPHATGSLFSIAGMHFLITASHVFDDSQLLFAKNTIARKIVSILGTVWRWREADVALVLLRDDVLAQLAGLRFLTLQDISLDEPTPAVYVAGGFPVELNLNRDELVGLGYISRLYTGSTAAIDFDPKHHILLEYDRSYSVGEDGTPSGMPDGLRGMSGCPIWRLDPNVQPDPASARVVGIQSATIALADKPHISLIKVVRWAGLLVYLVVAFPELEKTMNLHDIGFDRS